VNQRAQSLHRYRQGHDEKAAVTTEVIVRVADEIDVVATISTLPADALGLAVGKPAHVLIKASSIVVAID
jgi:molybdopterin-binding protein